MIVMWARSATTRVPEVGTYSRFSVRAVRSREQPHFRIGEPSRGDSQTLFAFHTTISPSIDPVTATGPTKASEMQKGSIVRWTLPDTFANRPVPPVMSPKLSLGWKNSQPSKFSSRGIDKLRDSRTS